MNLTKYLKNYQKCISCKTIQKTTFVFYSYECAFYIDIKELKINKNLIQLTDYDGEDYTKLRIDIRCNKCNSISVSKPVKYNSDKIIENFLLDNFNYFIEDFMIRKYNNKIKIVKKCNDENNFIIDDFDLTNEKELEKMLTKAKIYFAFS
jgi:hypothetical protein